MPPPAIRPGLGCVSRAPQRLLARLYFPFRFYYRSVAGPSVLWQFGSPIPATFRPAVAPCVLTPDAASYSPL